MWASHLMTVLELTIALIIVVVHARLHMDVSPQRFEFAVEESIPDSKYTGHVGKKQEHQNKTEVKRVAHVYMHPHKKTDEYVDIVDREDHVTQYLSDQMVNTDSEITILEAEEPEDENNS